MNLPNLLTFLRIIIIPIFVVVFYLPWHWSHELSAILFFIAGITDWLDGYIARRYHLTSPLGEFLDPVADKLIVVVALVLLVGERGMPYLAVPAAVIAGREIVISALREWMAEIGKRASIAVSYVGKIKTLIQMFAIFFLLLYHPKGPFILGGVGYIALYVAAIMTLWSMMMYIKTAWPDLILMEKIPTIETTSRKDSL